MYKDKNLLSKQCSKPCQRVNEPPWLNQETRKIVRSIFLSHQEIFKYELMKCQTIDDSYRNKSQELFSLESPVIAHNNHKDPRITYANSKALQLWGRQWREMIDMPSRLTAPRDQQEKRQSNLLKAIDQDQITGLQGIRVNQSGRRFLISNVKIWTLRDEDTNLVGQAASFSNWWYI